jgi:restriction system protein
MAEQRRRQAAADRQAAREAEQARKQAFEAGRRQEAADMAAAIERKVAELNSIHTAALSAPNPAVDFGALKRGLVLPSLDLGNDARPLPAPDWAQFEPRSPGQIGKILGGQARYAARYAEAELAFSKAMDEHAEGEAARQVRVAAARRAHSARVSALRAEIERHNAGVDHFAAAVRNHDRHAVSDYFQMMVDRVKDPGGFPVRRRAGFVPESALLAIEWYLPGPDIVPTKKSFTWVKSRDEFSESKRPAEDIRKIYQQLTAQVALRALHLAFRSDPLRIADAVVFNGMVQTIDPVTGQDIEPCLITLRATREQFEPLKIESLDPVKCVRRYFAADVSVHPDELVPVTPVMEFKMADPRVIDPIDVISRIDTRPNLLELTPKDFEHFIQNLFSKMKFDTQVFRADGDGGVDCVAYDPTPIRGGKYVIQAKLYRKTVPPTAVRDLYGTMQHEGAKSGILITTSGYGPSSYEFANGKPLQLIDGTGLLAICHEHGIPARIVR